MHVQDENPYAGYLVGIVVSCEPVPNKDSLFQLKVDVGGAEDLQIVTNAVNANAGKRVVVATVGSKVRLSKFPTHSNTSYILFVSFKHEYGCPSDNTKSRNKKFLSLLGCRFTLSSILPVR
jgi:hypothetical protein